MVRVKRELPDEHALAADPRQSVQLKDEAAMNQPRMKAIANHGVRGGVDGIRQGPIEEALALEERYRLNIMRAEAASFEFDHFGAQPAPAANVQSILGQKHWSHPASGGQVPGPQRDYETEFQVPPPYWFPPPRLQQHPPRPGVLFRHEIMELHKQQNTIRVEMAKHDNLPMSVGCGRVLVPPSTQKESPLQDHQEQLKILQQQRTARLAMVKEENPASLSSPEATDPIDLIHGGSFYPPYPGGENRFPKDSLPQLMLLEEQNKTRLVMAEQAEGSIVSQRPQYIPETTPGSRGQSVESCWSTQITPESTPGFQESQESWAAGINQIRLRFMEPHPEDLFSTHNSAQPSCNCATSGLMGRDHDRQLAALEQQNHVTKSQQELSRSVSLSVAPNWTLQYYQEQIMLQEQEERKKMMEMRLKENDELWRSPSKGDKHIPQDYQMQLKLLEQHAKKKERAAMRASSDFVATQTDHHHTINDDLQVQMALFEMANRKRAEAQMTWTQEVSSQLSSSANSIAEHALERKQEDSDRKTWATNRAPNMHKRPFVIRQRPTCDD